MLKIISRLAIILVVLALATIALICLDFKELDENDDSALTIDNITNSTSDLQSLISNNEVDETEVSVSSDYIILSDKVYIDVLSFINLTDDVYDDINNTISHNDFVAYLNNLDVITSNDNEYVLLEEIANDLGYNVTDSDDGYNLTRKFKSKRLLITSKTSIQNNYSAISVIKIDDLIILQYASEKNASVAYINFVNLSYVTNIDEDYEYDLDSDFENITTSSSNGFYSWGGELMGFDDYTNYLNSMYNELDEVVVAVVDTGINANHASLKNRIIDGSACFINGLDQSEWQDDYGHGTAVASVIADLTPSNVKMISIRIICSGLKTTLSFHIVAYKYILALKNNGLNIVAINGSYGLVCLSKNYTAKSNAINELIDNNIVCCFSAGNDSTNANTQYPAAIEKAITVSALSQNNQLAIFSNYGEVVDFTAPGVNIVCANPLSQTAYTISQGTSVASPHVVAAFALVLSEPNTSYTSNEIEQLLKNTATVDIGESGFDYSFGYGYIDLSKLIVDDDTDTQNYNISFNVMITNPIDENEEIGELNIYYINNENCFEFIDLTTACINAVTSLAINSEITMTASLSKAFDFVGYYLGSTSNFSQSTLLSTDSTYKILNELNKDGDNYIYAVLNRRVINLTVNLNYFDVVNYTGFASYGTRINIIYYNEKGEKVTLNHTSGFAVSEQVVTICVAYGTSVSMTITGENDSVISDVYNNSTAEYLNNFTQASTTVVFDAQDNDISDEVCISIKVLI